MSDNSSHSITSSESSGSKDLEELVGLAEKVSENIKSLDNKAFRARINQGLALLVAYGSGAAVAVLIIYYKNFEDPKFSLFPHIFFLALTVGMIYVFTVRTREVIRYKKEIAREKRVLTKLMGMISDLKATLDKGELGIVASAVIEMRLNRIEFSPDTKSY